jgi:hypothetical protein
MLATDRVCPHVIGMDVAKLMYALEGAWSHALPGHEAVGRDHVLRELWRLLQQQPSAREPMRLRVVRS